MIIFSWPDYPETPTLLTFNLGNVILKSTYTHKLFFKVHANFTFAYYLTADRKFATNEPVKSKQKVYNMNSLFLHVCPTGLLFHVAWCSGSMKCSLWFIKSRHFWFLRLIAVEVCRSAVQTEITRLLTTFKQLKCHYGSSGMVFCVFRPFTRVEQQNADVSKILAWK